MLKAKPRRQAAPVAGRDTLSHAAGGAKQHTEYSKRKVYQGGPLLARNAPSTKLC